MPVKKALADFSHIVTSIYTYLMIFRKVTLVRITNIRVNNFSRW